MGYQYSIISLSFQSLKNLLLCLGPCRITDRVPCLFVEILQQEIRRFVVANVAAYSGNNVVGPLIAFPLFKFIYGGALTLCHCLLSPWSFSLLLWLWPHLLERKMDKEKGERQGGFFSWEKQMMDSWRILEDFLVGFGGLSRAWQSCWVWLLW